MSEPAVVQQEVAAHLFVPLDSSLTDQGLRSFAGIWNRFRQRQGADEPVTAWIPTRIPDHLPDAPLHGSVPVAAVQADKRLDQAIVRRDHEILGLSLLLGAAPGRTWPDLRRRLDELVGPLGPAHLGGVTLLLGKKPDATAGKLELSELGTRDERESMRNLSLLGTVPEDSLLGAWAWSNGDATEMPVFVRYLMHMTSVRHQLAGHSRLADGGSRAFLRPPYGGGGTDRELTGPAEQLRATRHSVERAWDNACRALRVCDPAGDTLVATEVLDDDRNFVGWFTEVLDDELAQVELVRDKQAPDVPERTEQPEEASRAEPSHSAEAPSRTETMPAVRRISSERPVRVLVVADEWFSKEGGLSTFNRHLCIALVAAGADLYVLVEKLSDQERAHAAQHGVRLHNAARPGHIGAETLMRRPDLPGGFEPELVIGHGRVTGPAARQQSEDHFRGSKRLHFLHVEPDQGEWYKLPGEVDVGAHTAARTKREFDLCRGALRTVPVGARLENALLRERHARRHEALGPPLRIYPGFDTGTPVTGPPPPEAVPQILLMGRLDVAGGKGLDIACRALGKAVPERSHPGRWELVARGVPEGESHAFRTMAEKWIDNPAVHVIPRPYSSDPQEVIDDVARASLVLMPSRAESFGLVGLEAITAGVPVLVSSRSGLGMLLTETLPPDQVERMVMDVGATAREVKNDVTRWARAISNMMWSVSGAFQQAAEVRKTMADRVTWHAAATKLLDCARESAPPTD